MDKILAEFKEICDHPFSRAVKWKADNAKKIIGVLPMYFPDEMIHAAGMLPVTLFGDDEPITLADGHLMVNVCNLMRSTFDSLLKGKYDFLDGVGLLHVCDQVRFFIHVWQLDHPLPFFHQMWRPYKMDNSSRPFLEGELKRLKSNLETFTGQEITSEALRKSIAIYNESRAMMRKLNQFRSDYPGIISAEDMVRVVTSSMLIPREEHNKLLGALLSKLEATKAQQDKRIRIVAAGHPCEIPNDKLLHLIEEAGLVIVDDDFFTGGRLFAIDVKADGDPIEAFTDYYLNAVPCTTYHYPESWVDGSKAYSPYGDYLIDLVKKSKAKGIVLLKLMYCDPIDMEFVLLKKRLEEEGIPLLYLFADSASTSLEPIRTRVQAFTETLT